MYEVRRQQALAEVEEQDRALREAAVKQAQAETEARMAQAEKLASIGRVTAAVAHEINNPLSCLAMNLRFLRDDMNGGNYDREELASALAESIDGVSRIAHLVARLSGYARHDSAAAAMGAARLDAVVDRAVDLAEPHTRGRAAVRRQMEELPAALGQQGALVDVFVNLIVNAAQALPVERASENQILIHAFRRDPWLVVEVEDNGAGIPSDILPRCGEPFFTTRPIGEGTGLGLAVSRAAVRAVGGKLELESRPGRTVARVLLPVAELAGAATLELAAGALEPAATNGPIAPGVSGLRILIVDDDERVARSLQRVLSAHDVITVSSGRDALELLARRADFDLILCDLMMPGMTGMELYSELAEEYPDLSQRIIFVTGGAFTAGAREFCDRHAARVLGKPVSVEALTRVLLSVAGGRPAAT
jgi:nitrogen-specific signal transduction histidine kinase